MKKTEKEKAKNLINTIDTEIDYCRQSLVDLLRNIAELEPELACRLGKRARKLIHPTLIKVFKELGEGIEGVRH